MKPQPLAFALACSLLGACAHQPLDVDRAHITRDNTATAVVPADIPAPVMQSATLPPPRDLPPVETYNVVVNGVPAGELLFALARDANLNVDVHPGIAGTVTLNALDQTLPQILDRISEQVDLRYELRDGTLSARPDTPYLHLYKVDYLNMARNASSTVSIATQVAAPGGVSGESSTELNNNSSTLLENTSNNRFWETLVSNITDILRETDKVIVEGAENPAQAAAAASAFDQTAAAINQQNAAGQAAASATVPVAVAPLSATYREAASVISHPETGTLAVRATARQHRLIRQYLDQLIDNAQRQVLIEATVVEVELKDGYQQGINWDLLRASNSRFQLTQAPSGGDSLTLPGGAPTSALTPALGVISHAGALGSTDVSASIRLLESFGRTKVLSSPKISVLNNQTALIKVVDNLVYFTLTLTTQRGESSSGGGFTDITVTSEPTTVPVGFLMNVTPQVGDDGRVTLNLRPTISRLARYVEDPAVALSLALARGFDGDIPEVQALVPEIQTREMESIITIRDGQTAVLGGLMRDQSDRNSDAVPGLGRLKGVGNLFKYRNDVGSKSELVIFLRPTIIRDPSLQGDYRGLADRLPGADFFDSQDLPLGEQRRAGEKSP
ncbi:pilus (MSHA type) biogenesis protein MshL [Pseudomarimonas arenosa]|uniref:Type II and III secretion system protein n=1 Tax=Pseudomarimonas arenosa TaxID=2774145 RepID=A0AAW3ZMY5_9GAMM|nr:pilus (MSHA type) biogenesis protein MshL [Pseudomarimonas arenosa]MBD8525997.1 type II and III secretion system protein [Pseudomarimonas arenosa]